MVVMHFNGVTVVKKVIYEHEFFKYGMKGREAEGHIIHSQFL